MMTKVVKNIAWVLAIGVVVVCVIPAPHIVDVSHFDKVEHLLAFAALSLVFLRAYSDKPLWVITGCISFGLAIELIQYFIPWRSAEAADLLADILGVFAGWLVFKLYRWFKKGRNSHG